MRIRRAFDVIDRNPRAVDLNQAVRIGDRAVLPGITRSTLAGSFTIVRFDAERVRAEKRSTFTMKISFFPIGFKGNQKSSYLQTVESHPWTFISQ